MIYVETGMKTQDVFVERLKEFSASSDNLPIRMIFGNFKSTSIPIWTSDQAEACQVSLAHAIKNGVTMCVWGSSSNCTGMEKTRIPGPFYVDGNERTATVMPVLSVDGQSSSSAIPYYMDGVDHPVGEIADKAVWYFYYLGYLPDQDKLDFEAAIFEPIRSSLDSTRMEKFKEELMERSAENFSQIMEDVPKKRLAHKQSEIDNIVSSLTSLEQEIITTKNTARMKQKELDYMLNGQTNSIDHWRNQWKTLYTHSLIQPGSLKIENMVVSYRTMPLQIDDPEYSKSYPLGEFEVAINLENHSFFVKNKTQKLGGVDHPHVRSNKPCLGDYVVEVTDMFTQKEIAGLVEWLFGYLQSFNPEDDYGMSIRYWREKYISGYETDVEEEEPAEI